MDLFIYIRNNEPHHITQMNKIKFLIVNFRVESISYSYSPQLHVTTTTSKDNIYVSRRRDFQLLNNAFQQIPVISEGHHNSIIKQTKKWPS